MSAGGIVEGPSCLLQLFCSPAAKSPFHFQDMEIEKMARYQSQVVLQYLHTKNNGVTPLNFHRLFFRRIFALSEALRRHFYGDFWAF
jgi:hypothetical protein